MVVDNESTLLLHTTEALEKILVADSVNILQEDSIVLARSARVTPNLGTTNRHNRNLLLGDDMECLLVTCIEVRQHRSILILLVTRTCVRVGIRLTVLVVWRKGLQHKLLVGTNFEVVGNSNDIQTIVPSLTNTLTRSNLTVRIDGVNMEIGLVGVVAFNLRQDNLGTTHRLVVKADTSLSLYGSFDNLCRSTGNKECRSKNQK